MKIRISAVSYLNTKPFVYGMEKSGLLDRAELSLDIPSVCAAKLLAGQADIGLVPVAVLPQLKDFRVIGDHCIGASGAVRSVLLFSQKPLHEIEEVLLDPQSRTSVMLARILAGKHWKIQPKWTEASPGYEASISAAVAGVVIGDRALELYGSYPYAYDLAEEWTRYTSLPFVFACWVAHKQVPEAFLTELTRALAFGVNNREPMIADMGLGSEESQAVRSYLGHSIDYSLDASKRKALELFLDLCREAV